MVDPELVGDAVDDVDVEGVERAPPWPLLLATPPEVTGVVVLGTKVMPGDEVVSGNGVVLDDEVVPDVNELGGGLLLAFELFFPTAPPTAPPITAPRTRTTITKMVILPLRVRQKGWVGFWAYIAGAGANFSCGLLSTSVSRWVIGSRGGESG